MRVEEIEIHGMEAGRVSFAWRPVRRVQTRLDAATPLHPAPTREQADARLRQLAASLGADAVIDVLYQSGASWSSWKSMKATGLAVLRDTGDLPEAPPRAPGALPPEQLPPLSTPTSPRQIAILILFVLMLVFFRFALSQGM
jgi:uncharacterized protein YbjQ (UPF0145 family)